ncbi:MAG: hypothetical protein AAGA85_19255 [Bacteroidota bacterium]
MKKVIFAAAAIVVLTILLSFSPAEELQLIITVTSATPTAFDMVYEGVSSEKGLVTPQEFVIDATTAKFIFRSRDSTQQIVVTASREQGGGVTGSAPIVVIQASEEWISTVATDELED